MGEGCHFDIRLGTLLQRRCLALVDGHILGHYILTLHTALTGEATDHDSHIHILACLHRVGGNDNAYSNRREKASSIACNFFHSLTVACACALSCLIKGDFANCS